MDRHEMFLADVAREIERQKIGEQIVAISKRLGNSTLKTIGEKIRDLDSEDIDFDYLVAALQVDLWLIESELDSEDKDELYDLIERAKIVKGA